MSEYKQVKIGKLKLKGADGKIKKKKKRKLPKEEKTEEEITIDEDANSHNGWWSMNSFDKLNGGTIAIQLFNNAYIFANDNGTIKPGKLHDGTEYSGPKDEEMFTMIKISEIKVAFKSGYGKYISVNARGDMLARSEAVGPQEQLEVVIEGGKAALQGHNGYFVTLNDDNEIKSLSKVAKAREMICLRTNASRSKKKKVENEEDVGDVRKFEVGYVKQFQSFGDHHLKLHEGPKSSLESARGKGKLHEAMLDRREKMKADRYCK